MLGIQTPPKIFIHKTLALFIAYTKCGKIISKGAFSYIYCNITIFYPMTVMLHSTVNIVEFVSFWLWKSHNLLSSLCPSTQLIIGQKNVIHFPVFYENYYISKVNFEFRNHFTTLWHVCTWDECISQRNHQQTFELD